MCEIISLSPSRFSQAMSKVASNQDYSYNIYCGACALASPYLLLFGSPALPVRSLHASTVVICVSAPVATMLAHVLVFFFCCSLEPALLMDT